MITHGSGICESRVKTHLFTRGTCGSPLIVPGGLPSSMDRAKEMRSGWPHRSRSCTGSGHSHEWQGTVRLLHDVLFM